MTEQTSTAQKQVGSVTPRTADFRETVVREWFDREADASYWTVTVHDNLAFVFSPASTTPGWLSGLRFYSYEDAAAFAVSLCEPIRRAADGHRAMCDGARDAIGLISAERGRQPYVD